MDTDQMHASWQHYFQGLMKSSVHTVQVFWTHWTWIPCKGRSQHAAASEKQVLCSFLRAQECPFWTKWSVGHLKWTFPLLYIKYYLLCEWMKSKPCHSNRPNKRLYSQASLEAQGPGAHEVPFWKHCGQTGGICVFYSEDKAELGYKRLLCRLALGREMGVPATMLFSHFGLVAT